MYKDEILQLSKKSKVIALKNGTPASCKMFVYCNGCGFRADEEIQNCEAKRIIWLYDEYKEPIKLTAEEKAFLTIVKTGWIARDQAGRCLYWYSEKPERSSRVYDVLGVEEAFSIHKTLNLFNFIRWEDEPYSVEEMLTWEVCDGKV
jgi:hypothetical protein